MLNQCLPSGLHSSRVFAPKVALFISETSADEPMQCTYLRLLLVVCFDTKEPTQQEKANFQFYQADDQDR